MEGRREVGGVLFVLDRATGAFVQKYELERSYINLGINSAGIVYADVESYTLALDGKSGELLWKQAIRNDIITENVIYGRSIGDGIKAVDAQSGEVLWHFKRDKWFRGPLLSEGVLYAASGDGVLYALDAATGLLLWKYNTGYTDLSPMSFSAAAADGVLYLCPSDGSVYAIDIQQAAEKLLLLR
jgi:outer membrane protein assembly factor BamB